LRILGDFWLEGALFSFIVELESGVSFLHFISFVFQVESFRVESAEDIWLGIHCKVIVEALPLSRALFLGNSVILVKLLRPYVIFEA